MGKDDGKQQRFLFPRRTKRCGLALCGMGDGKVSSMWSGKRPSGGGVSAAALLQHVRQIALRIVPAVQRQSRTRKGRSEEHTSELQSLMRISYAVFCLKKKTKRKNTPNISINNTTQILNTH